VISKTYDQGSITTFMESAAIDFFIAASTVTQCEAMSYEFTQRVLPHVARHLPHARPVSRWFFAAHAEDANVLGAQMSMRTDGTDSGDFHLHQNTTGCRIR
jgi:hypothetical protein